MVQPNHIFIIIHLWLDYKSSHRNASDCGGLCSGSGNEGYSYTYATSQFTQPSHKYMMGTHRVHIYYPTSSLVIRTEITILFSSVRWKTQGGYMIYPRSHSHNC